MSVRPQDIDLKKALDQTAGKNGPEVKKKVPTVEPDLATALAQSLKPEVKKKDGTPPYITPLKDSQGGAVPGTTNTTTPKPIDWADNPLNPVKAATDYEANRDKTPEILFKDADKQKLDALLTKHNVPSTSPVVETPFDMDPKKDLVKPGPKAPMQVEYENAVNLESNIKDQIKYLRETRAEKRSPKSTAEKELENELQEVQNLKRKAATELVVNGDKEIEVNRRTNEVGNSFNQFMSDIMKLNSPVMGKKMSVKETEDKVMKMPTQFLTGVNMLKLTEPAEYERVTDAIAKGLPISASQTANITALGLNIEEAKLQRDIIKSPVTNAEREKYDEVSKTLGTIKPDIDKYEEMIKAKQPLSPAQTQDYQTKIQQYNAGVAENKPLIDKVNSIDGAFAKKANDILETRRRNLIDNPEVLRGFIADGVATKLDELYKLADKGKPNSTANEVGNFMLGHTWNYSPAQIKWASEQYLKEQGMDPSSSQAQAAIKFLQDNEGVMIGENSIAKAGGFRELGEGLISPITGTAKSLKDFARASNDTYIESQSQGNVDVAKKRLASEDTGIKGVLNDVLQGTGQFATQAALMYGTSGLIGTLAEGVMGKAGVELVAKAKSANIKTVIPFDDMTGNIAAGKFLTGIKDPLSVFTTSYAMAYDSNLKAALSYTSDNSLAKKAAMFNASMEGWTELFLSPLEIAEGIIHKFSKNSTKDILKILSDKSLKNDPTVLQNYVGKFVKGVLGTSKVGVAEIGEELVTQISDYVTNMYLNPNSDSFKSRNLKQELMTTAYQTGLSMAVPAVMNGIGAMKANSFSKGSLMVAAQNRQAMVDDLNKSVAQGTISQEQANQRIQLVNTAAEANGNIPKKASGADLNTNEKANYLWSRVTEAYMEKKMGSLNDAAAKEIWKDKILKQQDYRKQILGLKEEKPAAPEYTIDDKPVSREEFLQTAEEKPNDHNYVVTDDEEAQQAIRNIGGIDNVEEEKPEEEQKLPTDAELIKQVEDKKISNYETPSIKELKEQALGAPESFKNQFDDEELTVNLIAKNSEEAINNAIKYQQERLSDPHIDAASTVAIDKHIQLLEQGLEKNKQFSEEVIKPTDVVGSEVDIERRRQEELKENSDKDVLKVEDYELTDDEGNITYVQIRHYPNGKRVAYQNIEKNKYGNTNDSSPFEISKEQQSEDFINNAYPERTFGKPTKTGERSGKEASLNAYERKINAKYDAELAALPKSVNKPIVNEGQPLSKLEQLKAKKLLAKEEVPGDTMDEKLKHISEHPTDFGNDITSLANKRFPQEEPTKPIDVVGRKFEYEETDLNDQDKLDTEDGKHQVRTYNLKLNGEKAGVVELHEHQDKGYRFSTVDLEKGLRGKGIGKDLYRDVNRKSLEETGHTLWSKNKQLSEAAKRVWESLVKSGEAELTENGYRFKSKPIVNETKNKVPVTKGHTENVMPSHRFENVPDETLDKIIADVNAQADIDEAVEENSGNYIGVIGDKGRKEKIAAISREYARSKMWEENPEFVKAVEDAVKEEIEPKIKDVDLNKQIGLLSAEFLEINTPEISSRKKIIDVPISSISTDTSSFQNREEEYSQESVDKILKAVQEDNFNWTEFDPVTLWKNDDKLTMLSGHSRLEAFKQLTKRGYAGFDTVPSEIFEGSKEDATAIALRSNTLSTKETPIERANFYRESRIAGTSTRSILNEAKEYEGRNAPTIIALSYLNPRGKAIGDLKALGQEGDTKSKANSLQMARWVGEVRQQFPQITDAHENEIYDWLKDGAYSKIKNLAEISSRINNVVSGFDFDNEKPLNLEHRATKSYVDEHYEQQIADKEKQIKEQQKIIEEKSKKYNEVLTPQEVAEKLVPENAILSKMQQDYLKLKDKKGAISEANKGILSLFDNIQTEIDNGTITEVEVNDFIENTEHIEEDDAIIEDIERNAESADTATTAIEEGKQLIAGQDVPASRLVKAEKKLADKVADLEKEKRGRINEITKPVFNMNELLINDLFTKAATTEANRQEYDDIEKQFYSLKNLFDCLFA